LTDPLFGDTQSPRAEIAEFAAKCIPRVQLDVIASRVDDETFINGCDEEGRTRRP
jgi:hypothetical protein